MHQAFLDKEYSSEMARAGHERCWTEVYVAAHAKFYRHSLANIQAYNPYER